MTSVTATRRPTMTLTRPILATGLATALLTACGGGGGDSNDTARDDGAFCVSSIGGETYTSPSDPGGGCETHNLSVRLEQLAPLDDGTLIAEDPGAEDCSGLLAQAVQAYGEPETREVFDLRPIEGPLAELVTWQVGAIRILFEDADQGCRATSYPPL